MGLDQVVRTAEELGCTVRKEEPLSRHTTFQIGGPCRAFIEVPGTEEMQMLSQECQREGAEYWILGKGSNLLADDAGYDGIIMKLASRKKDILPYQKQGEWHILCPAGVSLASLCEAALQHSLTGLEFAWGIPGSVGGAVFMNAGAYGGEMSQVVSEAEVIGTDGMLVKIPAEQLDFSYRHSRFTDSREIIVSADFLLHQGDPMEIQAKMEELMRRRRSKQPLEYPSAGSTFKRPQGSYASLLIEQCGLKGFTVGGAQVSEKHAGFVINRENATFSDVMALIQKVQETVLSQTGYHLECEPKIVTSRELQGVCWEPTKK